MTTHEKLRVTTNAERICALLDPVLVADPVRHTVLGSICSVLASGRGDGWCASTADRGLLAVRSEAHTPVVLVGEWPSDGPVFAALVSLLRHLPTVAAISGAVDTVDTVVRALAWPHHRIAERLFRLDRLVPPVGVPGSSRSASTDDQAMLVEWYRAFGREALDHAAEAEDAVDRALEGGRIWLWTLDGQPVAMAARRAPVVGVARIGPVYTPLAHRGCGFGSAVTAAASRDILDAGAVPVLFTDLANPVSNAIYQRLGYRAVGDYAHISMR